MERGRDRGGREMGERKGKRKWEKERGRTGKREWEKEGWREFITLLKGSIVIYKSFKFECFLNELVKIITLVKFFEII